MITSLMDVKDTHAEDDLCNYRNETNDVDCQNGNDIDSMAMKEEDCDPEECSDIKRNEKAQTAQYFDQSSKNLEILPQTRAKRGKFNLKNIAPP